jgi:hypothetical protein
MQATQIKVTLFFLILIYKIQTRNKICQKNKQNIKLRVRDSPRRRDASSPATALEKVLMLAHGARKGLDDVGKNKGATLGYPQEEGVMSKRQVFPLVLTKVYQTSRRKQVSPEVKRTN